MQIGCVSEMDGFGSKVADACVAVDGVVPRKEAATEGARVFDAAETGGEIGLIFEGFERCFREGMVIGGVGAAMALGDPQVSEEPGDGLGGHGGTTISMHHKLTRQNLLFAGRLGDQAFSERCLLPVGKQPASDIATVDVQEDIEGEEVPLLWTLQFGDIPAPDVIGFGRQEFGLLIHRMDTLVPTVPALSRLGEEAVHRPLGGEETAFIEERGVHFRRSRVHKAVTMEDLRHRLPLSLTERTRVGCSEAGHHLTGTRLRRGGQLRGLSPVKGSARHPQHLTRGLHAGRGTQDGDGFHYDGPLVGSWDVVNLKSAETFFGISMISSAAASFCSTRSCSARKVARAADSAVMVVGRPRCDLTAVKLPSVCCFRHSASCDEYNPSRRSSAPSSPYAQLSASQRMRSLYAAVSVRRRTCSLTSGFGDATVPFRDASGDPLTVLSPCSPSSLALYFSGEKCLTLYWQIGTVL